MGEMENEFLRAGNTENAGEGRAWRQGTVHVSPVATVKNGLRGHTSHVTRHTSHVTHVCVERQQEGSFV